MENIPLFPFDYLAQDAIPDQPNDWPEDTYDRMNGLSLKLPLPKDKSREFLITEVVDSNTVDGETLVERSLRRETTSSDPPYRRLVHDLYLQGLDSNNAERDGQELLQTIFADINRITTSAELATAIGSLHAMGMPVFGDFRVIPDARDARHYLFAAYQGGTSLQYNYYLDATTTTIMDGLSQTITQLSEAIPSLEISGTTAEAVVGIEKKLAEGHEDRHYNIDPDSTYNIYTIQRATTELGFDWEHYFTGLGIEAPERIQVSQPRFITKMVEALEGHPIDDIKAYLRFTVAHKLAPHMGEQTAQTHFSFFEQTINGTAQMPPRHRRVADQIQAILPDSVGSVFTDDYLNQEDQGVISSITEYQRQAFIAYVDESRFDDATKAVIRQKLINTLIEFGGPQNPLNHTEIEGTEGYVTKLLHARQVTARHLLASVGGIVRQSDGARDDPIDDQAGAATINAYSEPDKLHIVFHPGFLRPPVYQRGAHVAVLFATLSIVAHELFHMVDTAGSQFNAEGELEDYMSADDKTKFNSIVTSLTNYINDYTSPELTDGIRLNGPNMVSEALADLGGLLIGYRGLKKYLIDHPQLAEANLLLPDGKTIVTPEQLFMLTYVRLHHDKMTPQYLIRHVADNPHPIGRLRGDLARLLPEFWEAFGTQPPEHTLTPLP